MNETDFIDALKEAISRAGTQNKLAKQVGCSQGSISDYITGRCSIGNMTISMMLRFFPDIQIHFFGPGPKDEISEALKEQILLIFDALKPSDRVSLFSFCAFNFPYAARKNLSPPEEPEGDE